MSEQPPSKELIADLRDTTAECYNRGLFGCASDVRRAIEEIERLRTALRGIQSCSTCEACRGAATLALGGATLTPEHDRLQRIEQLMDAQPGTPEGAELDRLVGEQERREAGWRDPPTPEPEPTHATAEYQKIQDFVISRGIWRGTPDNKSCGDLVLELAAKALALPPGAE